MYFLKKNRFLIRRLLWISIPFILYGLIKAWLWYGAYRSINEINHQLQGIAKISYKQISSSLRGSISIHEIAIFIHFTKETIRIRKLGLQTGNLYSLLLLSNKLKNKELPNRLALTIEHLTMDVDSLLLPAAPVDRPQTLLEQVNTLACSGISRFDASILKNMGYTRFDNSFSLNYHIDPLSHNLDIQLYHFIQDFFSYQFSLQILNVRKPPQMAELAVGQLPRLGKLSIHFEDEGFIPKKVIYCAQQNKTSKQAYVDKYMLLLKQLMTKVGIRINAETYQAYQKFLLLPINIDLSIDWTGIDNPIQYLNQIKPQDNLAQKLKLQLKINNNPINHLLLQISPPELEKKVSHNITINDPTVKPKKDKKYHVVTATKLKNYDRHQVIIKNNKGKTYKGQLYVLPHNRYEIRLHAYGGSISYYVKQNEIVSAKVLF